MLLPQACTALPAPVANRCVTSLRHVMRVRSAIGRELPGTNGRGRCWGRCRAQVQHGLLRQTLSLRAWTVIHLQTQTDKDGTRGQTKVEWVREYNGKQILFKYSGRVKSSCRVSYLPCPDHHHTCYQDENAVLLLRVTDDMILQSHKELKTCKNVQF